MHTASEMNGRGRRPAVVHGTKAASRNDKVMEKDQKKTNAATPVKGSTNAAAKGTMNRSQSRRERKIALQQDVDKLRKKLRHEENVHRALERAFTRPLGALPRLPPYLPSHTLELLAEVAVLEEEVVRLEEQVVSFRQGLYQEAIIFSSTRNGHLSDGERCVPTQLKPSLEMPNPEVSPSTRHGSDQDPNWSFLNGVASGKQTTRKPNPSSSSLGQDDRPGKENQSCTTNSSRNYRRSPLHTVTKSRTPVAPEKGRDAQTITAATDRKRLADTGGYNSVKVSQDDSSVPNKLSEELLRCLLTIFSQMSSSNGQDEERVSSPSVSGSCESSEDTCPQDPYGILEFGKREIGPYKQFRVTDASSFDQNVLASNSLLVRRLKALLRKLSSVDLVGLSHQHKLAFWINIYNSCMMNAFLEQGMPTSPHMHVALMPKATINVGGRVLSAMTIEHFILRLPYNVKHVNLEGMKSDHTTIRGVFGLEWPEPLVTFALSCGSWSSPAVRIYTGSRVEEELEASKRDYLQAAVGVLAPTNLAIPKLLQWYLLDFAKDMDSLMDWVCLQLPSELQQNAIQTIETGRRGDRPIQVLPYDFRFRYLLAS